jgi:alpha-ribazole phosphatase
VILLRHPRPLVEAGICYGRLDLEVGPDAPAEIAAGVAATPGITHVIASPARRCRALAEAVAARHGASLSFDARLWEMNFGDWEGVFWAEIDRNLSDPWSEDPVNRAPPGGETFGDVIARVGAVLATLPEGAAIVAHAGPIRAARMIIERRSFDDVVAEAVPYATPIDLREAARSWRISP